MCGAGACWVKKNFKSRDKPERRIGQTNILTQSATFSYFFFFFLRTFLTPDTVKSIQGEKNERNEGFFLICIVERIYET